MITRTAYVLQEFKYTLQPGPSVSMTHLDKFDATVYLSLSSILNVIPLKLCDQVRKWDDNENFFSISLTHHDDVAEYRYDIVKVAVNFNDLRNQMAWVELKERGKE